jgi:hypothetical protein
MLMHFGSGETYALTSSSVDSGFKVTWRRVNGLYTGLKLLTYDVGRHDVFWKCSSSEIWKRIGMRREEKMRWMLGAI